jgi:hypothetical protein
MSNGVIHHDGYSEKAVETVEKIVSNSTAELAALATTAKGEPGLTTLVFCVGGIYASLYVADNRKIDSLHFKAR